MNWEESKALTPLKRDFLRRFAERNQAFYLTGGSALGIFYLEHRLSYDLDFFTLDAGAVNWHLLENQIIALTAEISARCRTLTASPEFHRFELTRGADREILDFVIERAPQVDRQKEQFGNVRVDTLREIMVNKVCTLVGRCEVKDLVDLYFLHKRGLEVANHFAAAQTKEGGLEPAMISFLLSQVKVDRPPDYLLQPLDLADFNRFIRNLQKSMADLALPDGHG
jgi:hypothetical protein